MRCVRCVPARHGPQAGRLTGAGRTERVGDFCRPSGACWIVIVVIPMACAMGYFFSPLRGFGDRREWRVTVHGGDGAESGLCPTGFPPRTRGQDMVTEVTMQRKGGGEGGLRDLAEGVFRLQGGGILALI